MSQVEVRSLFLMSQVEVRSLCLPCPVELISLCPNCQAGLCTQPAHLRGLVATTRCW